MYSFLTVELQENEFVTFMTESNFFRNSRIREKQSEQAISDVREIRGDHLRNKDTCVLILSLHKKNMLQYSLFDTRCLTNKNKPKRNKMNQN